MTRTLWLVLLFTMTGCGAPAPSARPGSPALAGSWVGELPGRITCLALYPDERPDTYTIQTVEFVIFDGKPNPVSTEFFTSGVIRMDCGTLLWTAPYSDPPAAADPQARHYYLVRTAPSGVEFRPLRAAPGQPPTQVAAAVSRALGHSPDDPSLYTGPWRPYRPMDPQRDRPLLGSLIPPGYPAPF